MKVTFRTGLILDGDVQTSVKQEIELPDDCLPTEIEQELEAWARSRTFLSYDAYVDVLPETPEHELHPVH